MTVPDALQAALAHFASATRLYQLTVGNDNADLGAGGLLVEAFAASEELQTVGARDIIVLSTNAHLELKALLGRPASLLASLADGSRTAFSGLINQAAMLGSEGGLARYRLRLVPWLWLLSQARTSRVWQDKSVIEIVDSVFAAYRPHADWRWSDEVGPFMADTRPHSHCIQYRETDLDFITRLLTEEGLGWRHEEHADSPGTQRLVLFADSSQACALPEDATSAHLLGGIGIRYHGARSMEQQDSIQAFGAKRTLNPALTTVLSYDYKSRRAIAASVPTHHPVGGKQAPRLESYDHPGLYAWATSAEAERYAKLQQQAHEARNKWWQGRSSVRTLRPGTRFTLTQGPLQQGGDQDPAYAVLAVTSVGLNNLPKPAQEGLAELFGPLPELLADCLQAQMPDFAAAAASGGLAEVIAQARLLGYANCFEAIRADIPWRPVLADGTGLRRHSRPTAPGSQSAIVVGADGQDSASGADEICCDRLGRIRIRFHWQDQHGHDSTHANATCWVRVAQRSAGPGMGSQFLPRIGQEVLVQFLEGDINRPLVVGALYNGQGEGGLPPTPGGRPGRSIDLGVYQPAHDHAAAAQGNMAGGHSPLWHGAGPNATAAQWGIRSKEFGGQTGYNQLLFDDTARQGRIQLKTTQAATELNLGHLIHSADNYRGSFRGLGAELRTDAYGAIRAGAGLLLSTYAIAHDARSRDPAGYNAAGLAHLKQAIRIGQQFSQAARIHQSVTFASVNGSSKAGASVLDKHAAPLPAIHSAASGMLSGGSLEQAQEDAASKNVRPGDGQLPHSTDPIIAIAGRAGLGMVAADNLQFANGETITAISGQDSQFIGGQQWRVHSGQAIGLLAGATAPGADQLGLQLVAAQQPIELQAQSDELKIQARDAINILSSHAHIDWAAKSISLSTAGGANITIEGGNITVQCPGKLLIQAGKKSFSGPTRLSYPLPKMPRSVCKECLLRALRSGSPLAVQNG